MHMTRTRPSLVLPRVPNGNLRDELQAQAIQVNTTESDILSQLSSLTDTHNEFKTQPCTATRTVVFRVLAGRIYTCLSTQWWLDTWQTAYSELSSAAQGDERIRLRARSAGLQAANRVSSLRAVEVEDSLVAARSCVATLEHSATA
jgi:hypothetical protein